MEANHISTARNKGKANFDFNSGHLSHPWDHGGLAPETLAETFDIPERSGSGSAARRNAPSKLSPKDIDVWMTLSMTSKLLSLKRSSRWKFEVEVETEAEAENQCGAVRRGSQKEDSCRVWPR